MAANTDVKRNDPDFNEVLALLFTTGQLLLRGTCSRKTLCALRDALKEFTAGDAALTVVFMTHHLRTRFIGDEPTLRPWRHQLHRAGIYTFGELLQWETATLTTHLKLPTGAIKAIREIVEPSGFKLGIPMQPAEAQYLRDIRLKRQKEILRTTVSNELPGFHRISLKTLHRIGILNVADFIRRMANERENVLSFCQSLDCNNPTLTAQEIIESLSQYGFLEGSAYIPDGVTLPAADE